MSAVKVQFAVLCFTLGGCADVCANTEASSLPSPDDKHKVVIFQRDCGATTGFSTQISVLDADDAIAGTGNAFVADDDHGKASAGEWGGPWAEARWLSNDELLIRYASKSRIFTQNDQASGVHITYEQALP